MVLVSFLCNPNALGSIRSDVNIFFILQIDEFEGIEEIMKKKRVGKVIFEMMSSSSTTVTQVKSTFARHSQNKIQRRCVVHRLTFLPCSISCFKFQMRPSRNLNMCVRKFSCQQLYSKLIFKRSCSVLKRLQRISVFYMFQSSLDLNSQPLEHESSPHDHQARSPTFS